MRPQDGDGTGTADCDIGAFEAAGIPAATVTIADLALAEGNAGTTNFLFTVTVTNTNGLAIDVTYSTADGTAVGALACGPNIDYQTTAGTLNLAANATSGTITVPVCGEALFEADETFVVNLTASTNSVIGDNQATGTITIDDPRPGLFDQRRHPGRGRRNDELRLHRHAYRCNNATVERRLCDGGQRAQQQAARPAGPEFDYVQLRPARCCSRWLQRRKP